MRAANESGEPHTFAGLIPGQLDELVRELKRPP